ncbi:hypothetical protein KX729_29710 [Rhizobium sp. XQZ8]|nr:hypothetical protein [Rhizobium populisoli]
MVSHPQSRKDIACLVRCRTCRPDLLKVDLMASICRECGSPAYLARRGVPQSLDDLRSQAHRTIHYSRTLGTKPYGWEYPNGDDGEYETLSVPGSLHVNSVQTYEAAGLAGMGLIQAAYSGIRQHLESGAMVEVLLQFRPEPLDGSLVVAHRRNLSPRVRAFMKWVEGVLQPYLE